MLQIVASVALALTVGLGGFSASAKASSDYLLGWYTLRDGSTPSFNAVPQAPTPSGTKIDVAVGTPIYASELVGAIRKHTRSAVIPDYLRLGDNKAILEALAAATKRGQARLGVDELNMALVLRLVSNLMVEEASFLSRNGKPELSPAVPQERVEYALRQILVYENRRLNLGCAEEDTTPTRQEIEAFSEQTGESALPSEEWVLFERLKQKIGFKPYAFTVRWDARTDPRLVGLAGAFTGSWPELVISGQRWPAGVSPLAVENGLVELKERFPSSLAGLRGLVEAKLSQQALKLARERLVESWIADLVAQNPQAAELSKQAVEDAYFRDFSRNMEQFAVVTANATVTEMRVGVADAMSDEELDPANCGLMNSAYFRCEHEFNDAFSAAVNWGLKDLEAELKRADESAVAAIAAEQTATEKAIERIENKLFVKKAEKKKQQEALKLALGKRVAAITEASLQKQVELRQQARTAIPEKAFSSAVQALREVKSSSGQPVCASFPAEIKTVKIDFDSSKQLLSAADKRQAQLISLVLKDRRVGLHPLPGLGVVFVEDSGSVYRYVVSKMEGARGSILPPEDEKVAAGYRKDILTARAAAPALRAMMDARYALHADTASFDFAGVSGLRIKGSATSYGSWLPQLFRGDNAQLFKAALE